MKVLILLAVLLALSLLVVFVLRKGQTNVARLEAQVLAIGDSITFGYKAKRRESYPAELQSLSGRGVINAGINGERSDGALARLPGLLDSSNVRTMVLCTGANDILQQYSMSNLKSNLKRMIAIARERGVDVVLIGVPFFGSHRLASLPLYDEVAAEENVAYMPYLLPDVLGDRRLRADHVHPNAAGYRYMAEAVLDRLRKEGYLP